MKKVVITLLVAVNLAASTIHIAVAANVSYAIKALTKEFNKVHPDTKVQVTLGSSGKLTAQIKHHAPYDLFMSANMMYPEALYSEGLAISKPVVYAKGSLAYLSLKKRDFSKGVKLLQEKDIKKIAVANPKTAPYGKATKEALIAAKVYKKIKNKFIYGESISQTLSFTVTASDMGIVAKSALFSPQLAHFKEGVNWSEVDKNLYTPISQGMVKLKNSHQVDAFYMFMLGDSAQKILKNFGYTLP